MSPFRVAFLGLIPSLVSPALRAEGKDADDEAEAPPPRAAFLGVTVGALPEGLRFHTGIEHGATVVDVVPDSPAAAAGIERFDIVVAFNGETVDGPEDIVEKVGAHEPGAEVRLSLRRRDRSFEVAVKLGARDESSRASRRDRPEPGFLGVGYGVVPEVLRVHLRLEPGAGVLVGEVLVGSPAAKAGVREFDVILAVDGKDVFGPEEFVHRLRGRSAGEVVALELVQAGERKSLTATLRRRTPRDAGLPWGPSMMERRIIPYGRWPAPHWGDGPDWDGLRSEFRGKVIIEDEDGSERSIPLPVPLPSRDELHRIIRRGLGEVVDDSTADRLRERVEMIVEKLATDGLGEPDVTEERQSSIVVRRIQGSSDIRVSAEDGVRTVTVTRDGETIARDLPVASIDELPDDVRVQVEALLEVLASELRSGPEIELEREEPTPEGSSELDA